MPRTKTELSPKEARFADEYIVDFNITDAAIRAGYSAKHARTTGQEVLARPRVAAAIAARQATLSEKTGITQEWIVEKLVQNANRSLEIDNGAAANKALELLGKTLGMFTDRVDHTTNGQTLPPSAIVVTLVKATRE